MVVPGTLRDSLLVLDGLLENRTSLEPVEVTSLADGGMRPLRDPSEVEEEAISAPLSGEQGL
jgi:hypothetical protein